MFNFQSVSSLFFQHGNAFNYLIDWCIVVEWQWIFWCAFIISSTWYKHNFLIYKNKDINKYDNCIISIIFGNVKNCFQMDN